MVSQGVILNQRYLIEEEIGTGGMATVYRAVDLRTGANVAVKVPHAFLVRDTQYIQRLRREAQIAASVHSPRIALVTDFAEHEGIPYVVMEYVPGENLAERLAAGGALPPAEAVRIILEAARALEAAHNAGIVHRDLKPHNIRLTADGDVKVLDFGIARTEGQAGLTSTSIFLGSPDYAAPERAEGLGDIRSDIYSLGITLYELLTGQLPFGSGTPYTILHRQVSEPPRPLPEGLPTMLYPIVARCLEKRPEDRYQTPRELAQDLAAALRQIERDGDAASRSATHPTIRVRPEEAGGARSNAAQSPQSPPAAFPPRPPTSMLPPPDGAHPATEGGAPRSRLPLLATAGAGGVLVILLVAFLVLRGLGGSSPAGDTAGIPGATATGQATVAAGALAAGGPSLKVIQPADGARVTQPVDVRVSADGLNLKPPSAGDPNGRHLHYFLDVDPATVMGPGQPVPTGQANIIHTAETEQIFNDLAPGAHTVTIIATSNDHLPLSPPVQAKVTFTVLPSLTGARSGDAAPLAFQRLIDGKWAILTMNADGSGLRQLTPGGADAIDPAWSPDGKQLAFASDREGPSGCTRIFVMNADGSNAHRVSDGPGKDRSPSWSPDGKFIVYQSEDRPAHSLLHVVAVEGGASRLLTNGERDDAQPVWSPDGALIAFLSASDSKLMVVDAAGGEPREVKTGPGGNVDPAWSPDGTRLAFASFRNGAWNVYVVALDGGDARPVTDSGQNVVNQEPAWSPDAKQIVFRSDRAGQQHLFIAPADGGAAKQITQGQALDLAPVWPLH